MLSSDSNERNRASSKKLFQVLSREVVHFHSIPETMNIFLFIFISILWSTCIIANSIIVITFFRIKFLRDNYSYWFTTVLATCDLIFGGTAIPLQVLTTEQIIPVNHFMCDILVSYQSALGMMEIFILIGMAVDRYISVSNPRLNDDRRQEVTKYLMFGTVSTIIATFIFMAPKHEYDFTRSNCFILKKSFEFSLWTSYILVSLLFVQFTVMGYFNVRVFLILRKFNVLLQGKLYLNQPEVNNRERMELSYDGGKASVVQIITSNPAPTIHEIRRGKTIREWIKESKKQRRLLIMIIALEFTSFFTNLPSCLMYFAMNYSSCKMCRESHILRNISPWAFYVNQAIDPLILLLTNKSFRRGARLLFSRSVSSRSS